MSARRSRLSARVSKAFHGAVLVECRRRRAEGLGGATLAGLVEMGVAAMPDDADMLAALVWQARGALDAPQQHHLRVDVPPDVKERADRLALGLSLHPDSYGAGSVRDVVVAALFSVLEVSEDGCNPYAPDMRSLSETERRDAVGRFAARLLPTDGHRVTRSHAGRLRSLDDIDDYLDSVGAPEVE